MTVDDLIAEYRSPYSAPPMLALAGLDAVAGSPFADLLPAGDVPTVTRRLRQVLEIGEAHVARIQRLRRGDGSELVVSMSILPAAVPQEGLTVSMIAMARLV